MKIIGFSSGGTGHTTNTDRIVMEILDRTGRDFEFVKLTDLTFSGCKGCVQLCAGPQVCGLPDEATEYYQKIKDADAVVLGAPVYSGSINTIMLSFLERFFGFRHVTMALKDKPIILVVCGFRRIDAAVEQFTQKLKASGANIIEVVTFLSDSPPCLSCGRHQECSIGGLYGTRGKAAHTLEITPELFLQWEDNNETICTIQGAASKLDTLL